MRKLIPVFLTMFLLSCANPVFAAFGLKVDGVNKGAITDLNFRNAGTTVTSDGSTATINLMLAGTGLSGAATMTSNDTDVDPSYAFVRKAIGFSAQAGTLDNGSPGQVLTILISQEVDTGTFVLTPTTKTGYASIEFNDAGDLATLLYLNDTLGWVVIGGNSLTINQ